MKKLFLLLVLSMLCFVNPTGNYAYAGESVVDWEEDDDSCEDGGSSNGGGLRTGYVRELFTLEYTVRDSGGERGGGSGGIGTYGFNYGSDYDRTVECITLSCCVKARWYQFRAICDFGLDDRICDKYVDRENHCTYRNNITRMN